MPKSLHKKSARQLFVVIVQRTPLQSDVYGPYLSFKTAEGDAKAWGGTVEPVKPVSEGQA